MYPSNDFTIQNPTIKININQRCIVRVSTCTLEAPFLKRASRHISYIDQNFDIVMCSLTAMLVTSIRNRLNLKRKQNRRISIAELVAGFGHTVGVRAYENY